MAKPPPASPELLGCSNKTQRSQGTFWFFLGSTLFKNSFSRQATGKKNALQSSRDGLILPTPGADFGVLTSTCTAEHGESQPHSSLRAAAPFLLRAAAWAQKHGFSSRNGETFQQPSQLLSRCQTKATSLDAHNTDGSATEQKPQRRSKPYMYDKISPYLAKKKKNRSLQQPH